MATKVNFDKSNVLGAVLTGGKSSRFNGCHKSKALLADKSLLAHSIERLEPQVAALVINTAPKLEWTDQEIPQQYPRIADEIDRRDGPLIGVLSCMRIAHSKGYQWLQICPCDSPFLPTNLVEKNLKAAQLKSIEKTHDLIIPHSPSGRQPTFSLWSIDLLPTLERAVKDEGKSGFKQFFECSGYAASHWSIHDEVDVDEPRSNKDSRLDEGFFNINTNADLETAKLIVNNGEHY